MTEEKKKTETKTKAPAKKPAAKKSTAKKAAPKQKPAAKKTETAKKKPAAKKSTTKAESGKKTASTKKAAPKKSPKKSPDKKADTKAKKTAKPAGGHVPNLKAAYQKNIIPALMKRFGYENIMQVPRLLSITINMGIGDGKNNPKALESAINEVEVISGQKAVVTKSRKDISNFKIRRGYPVGCKASLRSNRMYEFLERLISIALPRTRDFNGLSFKSFDGRGNYSFGIKEQIVFTEIDYDKIDSIRGMDIAIATSAETRDEAYWLLKEFGFPLRQKPVKTDDIEAA